MLKFRRWQPKRWPGRLKASVLDAWHDFRVRIWKAVRMPLLVVIAALVVAATTAALAAAVLIPNNAPHWLRDAMLLGGGDDTATTPWVRWALLVAAVLLLLLARSWGQTAWPDVALALVLCLAGFSAYKEHRKAEQKRPAEAPPRVTFTLPKHAATATKRLSAGTNAIVLVVEPARTVGKTTLYDTKRYEAKLVDGVGAGVSSDDVRISLERGAKDTNAAAFSADLGAAKKIFLLPSEKKTK